MKTMIASAASAIALLTVSSAPAAEPIKDPAQPRQCFYSRMVTSFAAADEKTLYVKVRNRDVYAFEMFGRCPYIDFNQRLALRSRGASRICTGLDAEIVSRTPTGPQRCPVRSLRKLSPQEIAALPRHARP